ncbi:MAG: hypothetical protein GY720_03375 [bacterium]|nr:hypothetical protein [bacterium]
MKEGFDGQKQRRALNAAEQTLHALASGNTAQARRAAAEAAEFDQIGLYTDFALAVTPLVAQLDAGGVVDDAGWSSLVDTLGIGPLAGLVEELRR